MRIVCNDKNLRDVTVLSIPQDMGPAARGTQIPPHTYPAVIDLLETCGSKPIENVRYDFHITPRSSPEHSMLSPTDVVIEKDCDGELDRVGYIVLQTKDNGAVILALPNQYRKYPGRVINLKNVLSEWEGPKWAVRIYA